MSNPVTYEAWVAVVFDHPYEEPKWYLADTVEHLFADDLSQALPLLCQTFDQVEVLLQRFSPDQVAEGLWYLAADFAGGYVTAALEGSASFAEKKALLASIESLFTRFFSVHSGDSEEMARTCDMWWDIDELYASGAKKIQKPVQEAILDVLERLSAVPNQSCQKAALHGLAHWLRHGSQRARSILEQRLALSALNGSLRGYIEQSLAGKGM